MKNEEHKSCLQSFVGTTSKASCPERSEWVTTAQVLRSKTK